jgi:hypothetical protein
MITYILAATINTTQLAPTTKREWESHIRIVCDQSQVGKTETEMEWFARCFPAKSLYFEWLQKHHPKDYLELLRIQNERTLQILRNKK